MIYFTQQFAFDVTPPPPPPISGFDGCHLVPILTSYTSPSPITCSAPAGTSSSYPAWQIFDGTANSTVATAVASGTLYTVYLGVPVLVDKVFCISNHRANRDVTHIKLYIGTSADYTQCTCILDSDVTLDSNYSGIVDTTDKTTPGTYLHFICDSAEHRPQPMELIPVGGIATSDNMSLVRLNAYMSSPTAPWGIVTGNNYMSGQIANGSPFGAYVGSDNRYWSSYHINDFVTYEFPLAMRVKQMYTMHTAGSGSAGTDALTLKVEALDAEDNVLATKTVDTVAAANNQIEFDGYGVVAKKVRLTRLTGDTATHVVNFRIRIDGYSVKHS